jgi:hypothetical protein
MEVVLCRLIEKLELLNRMNKSGNTVTVCKSGTSMILSKDRIMFLILLVVADISTSIAQFMPVEIMMGDDRYYHQHSVAWNGGDNSRIGFFHTSSMHIGYANDQYNEVMSQSYLTYKLNSIFRVAAGTFYATVPGFKLAGGVQATFRAKNLLIVFVPRVDIAENSSYEVMTFLEYRPPINDRLSLYSRAQLMSNYGPYNHNRSYQNFRAGLSFKNFQVGLALNVDEYGGEKLTTHNSGVFLRYELHN